MYRQGDVLLIQVKDVPREADPVEHCIVAHGEVTGHTHRIESGAHQFLTGDGRQYVQVVQPSARLVHEEHGTVTLPGPGVYRIIHQREYVPPEEIADWKEDHAPNPFTRPVRD